jgi:integrase
MPKVRLTDAAVQKMRPPERGRLEIMDSIVTRLALRITPHGHKSWSVGYRYNGRLRRYTIGDYPTFGVAEARDEAREALRLVSKGEDPAYLKKEKISSQRTYTFRAVLDEYVTRYAMQKNRTWEEKKGYLETYAVPMWGNMPIANIKKKDVIALIDKLMDRKVPYTANNVFSALRKLFNWAAERDIIEFSPCAHIKLPMQPTQRDRVLTDAEIKAIWATCDTMAYPFGTMIQLLLVTGQRRDEIAQMRWKEIDFDARILRLAAERVKTNRSHEVPLSPLAIEILSKLPRFKPESGGDDSEHFVFTTTGGRRPYSGFSKSKKVLDARSKAQDWRIHDLRRTAATNMARLGIPVSTISKVLNHVSGGVTAIYNRHTYLPEKTEALEKWAAHITKLLKTP